MIQPKDESGLNKREWARWRRYLLTHGTYDPNEWHRLGQYQKDWTQDTLNTLRQLEHETTEDI